MMEQEIKTAWKLLEVDADALAETGSTPMKFIIESDGERGVILAEDDAANDTAAKNQLADLVQAMVGAKDAHTVYQISDAWVTTILGQPKDRANLINYVNSIGVKKASDMGLVERREALMCQITTRKGESALLQWYYDRDEENRTITMKERKETVNDPINAPEGRFSCFFE